LRIVHHNIYAGLTNPNTYRLAEASGNLSLHTPDQVIKSEILRPRNTI
jgi:hypothetical protein